MAIVYDELMALEIAPAEQTYEPKDCMLYALGVGLGYDPLNENELAFVYEKNLKVLPTMVTVLAHTSSLVSNPRTGINWPMVVNGEQGFTLLAPLAERGTLVGRTRIVDVIDKGAGRGALLLTERTVTDKASGALVATVTQTIFCRGDGGFGGPPRRTAAPHPLPVRAPDAVCEFATRPEMALIYRLSGDYNPLHADPAAAKAAGFERPILHGLATLGVVGHALLKAMCAYDPARLTALSCRFSAPVFPGESIRTEMWREGSIVRFRARVVERDVVVIDHGRAEVRS
jgi:acyl dehydratase